MDYRENFCEAPGFQVHEAIAEAGRCIFCNNPPCAGKCPAAVDVAAFIRKIKTKSFKGAYKKLLEKNVMPGICARICPQQELCEAGCNAAGLSQPVAVGKLQRFIADSEEMPKPYECKPLNGKQVAIIGSGPAGLEAAYVLRKEGVRVTIFEKEKYPGGVLTYGIPAFRLPYRVTRKEIDYILSPGGIELRTQNGIASQAQIDELRACFDAVLLCAGLGKSRNLNINGEDSPLVVDAADILKNINLCFIEERPLESFRVSQAMVVGGGNVAMDAAASLCKIGVDVTILYRRSEQEMPAWKREIKATREMGVKFMFLVAPILIENSGGNEITITLQQMRLGEPDASGRCKPVPVEENGKRQITTGMLVRALGQEPNVEIIRLLDLPIDAKGNVVFDAVSYRVKDKIFAAGDIINGGTTAVRAIGEGRTAAEKILQTIQ